MYYCATFRLLLGHIRF